MPTDPLRADLSKLQEITSGEAMSSDAMELQKLYSEVGFPAFSDAAGYLLISSNAYISKPLGYAGRVEQKRQDTNL